jgi:hypothetical protein
MDPIDQLTVRLDRIGIMVVETFAIAQLELQLLSQVAATFAELNATPPPALEQLAIQVAQRVQGILPLVQQEAHYLEATTKEREELLQKINAANVNDADGTAETAEPAADADSNASAGKPTEELAAKDSGDDIFGLK